MNQISINGDKISTNGRNVTISNNKVYIDGQDVTPDQKNISIVVTGNLDNLRADACRAIDVKGSVLSLNTMSGDVKVAGNVDGSVRTMSGDVSCQTIGGIVSTMSGDVKCKGL